MRRAVFSTQAPSITATTSPNSHSGQSYRSVIRQVCSAASSAATPR